MTGLYLSGHPMDKYEEYTAKAGCVHTYDLIESAKSNMASYKDGSSITLCGIITHITVKQTRANKANMAFVTVEDLYGTIELVFFPKTFLQYSNYIIEGNVIVVNGTLSIEDEKEPKILVNIAFKPNPRAMTENTSSTNQKHKRKGLFLKFSSSDDNEIIKKAKIITSIFDGDLPLYYYYEDTKRYELQARECFVDVNETMLSELKRILGDRNVVVIY